jgi:hypothetical protein
VGDEAWDVDYFLHENPELKRAPYAWLTDFVGWLPMPDGGEAEAALTADYNAEMIEQIGRFPRLRDRAVFVGNPGDVVPDGFGADLPPIRDWVEQHYQFSGYISGYDPAEVADRDAIRAELGYRPDEKVCLVTVGGSGVGTDLLRRVIAAYPAAKRLVPALRMIVVTGPRIDPATLPAQDGLELHGYVHDLYRQLAACDLAVVQGGLTTTMELTAARRPFIYVPLRHHFEQNFHVRHRLDRYRAGRCLEYTDTEPESLAQAMAAEIAVPSVTCRWKPTVRRGPPPTWPSSSEQARRAARFAPDVNQAVLPGQGGSRGPPPPAPGRVRRAGRARPVDHQGRRQRGHPGHPLHRGEQRDQGPHGRVRLIRRQPGPRDRQVRLISQHPRVPGRQRGAGQQPAGLGEDVG